MSLVNSHFSNVNLFPADGLSHESREWLPAYFIPLEFFTTILLGVRLLSRFQWEKSRLGLDDLFITMAWAIGVVNTSLSLDATINWGFDRHVWDSSPSQAPDAFKLGTIIGVLYVVSTSFTKISILCFHRRLIRNTYSTIFMWNIFVAITIIVVYTVVIITLTLRACTPMESIWMRFSPAWAATHKFQCHGTRFSATQISYAAGIISVVTDLYTVLLPLWFFAHLRITRRQRVGLMAIFGGGFLVVVAGIVRTLFLLKAEGPEQDRTWNTFNVVVAGKTEGDFGIIFACAPSFKSVFRHYFRDRGINNSRSETQAYSPKRSSTGTEIYGKMMDSPTAPTWYGEEIAIHEEVITKDEPIRELTVQRSNQDSPTLPHFGDPHPGIPFTLPSTESSAEKSEEVAAVPTATHEAATHIKPQAAVIRTTVPSERTYTVDMMMNPLRAHPDVQSPRPWLYAEQDPAPPSQEEEELMRRIQMYR